MRNLSATALAKISNRLGNEPIVIIEVQWVKNGGWQMYADRDIGSSVRGKILDLGNLDDVVAISENNDSQEISVTLDDTTGEFKAIIDQNDVHQRDVRVWQWFDGLPLEDRFLLFGGKINSPIIWNEGSQTFSFSIISQIEDKEFGFSPEEGTFPYIPVELIGKAWPSCFGTPVEMPACAIGLAIHGTTLTSVGILSGRGWFNQSGSAANIQTAVSLAMQAVQQGHLGLVASMWGPYSSHKKKYMEQYDQIGTAIANAWGARAHAIAIQQKHATKQIANINTIQQGKNPVRILGGQTFPRGTITLDIGGGLFTGFFGPIGSATEDIFQITSRLHVEDSKTYEDAVYKAQHDYERVSPGSPGEFDFKSEVPCGLNPDSCTHRTHGWIVAMGVDVMRDVTVLPIQFWSNAGAAVSMYSGNPIAYIVSIVPGTVLSVKAFKQFGGASHLVEVPKSNYTIENKVYGSIHAVQINIVKALSAIPDQNWSDELYVTFRSDVGPNIVDILEYIIDLYTEFSVDHISFDHVRERLAIFPANFAVLDRKNVLTILQEIAYQARCSLRLVNGIFYLTYLPEAPTPIDSIIESDIEVNTIEVQGTPSEDIVTKSVTEWRASYAHSTLNKLILRHNIAYYGLREETTEFYIYNDPTIILKAATFWLIRKANTWKILKFRTFLNKLNVETLDCITIAFKRPYVTSDPVNAIVKQATFNSADRYIDMECWLPVKFGTMIPYDFAWPADVSASWVYPTDYEVVWGHAGGAWVGEDADGELPLERKIDDAEEDAPFVGGATAKRKGGKEESKTDKKRTHDTGDKYPSDKKLANSGNGSVEREYGKEGEITVNEYKPPVAEVLAPGDLPQNQEIPLVGDGLVIDLSSTIVRDGKNTDDKYSFLSDLLRISTEKSEPKICLKDTTNIWSEEDPTAEFDFKYDSEEEVWGAKTAWLRDHQE
jgi:hypothetical protein